MNEKVVVMGGIPNYMPKFRNALCEMAAKQALRKSIIEEIINADFTNGIAPLIKELNGLDTTEIDMIINMWNLYTTHIEEIDYKRLICLYEEPLRSGDISKIEVADAYFYDNIEKFKNSLGRG